MTSRSRGVRYERRKDGSARTSRAVTAVIIVVIFLVLCAIVSVVIGIALGKRADQVDIKSKYSFSFEPYKSGDKTVRAVDAFYYRLGTDAKGYISDGKGDLSLALRHVEGDLTFKSSTAEAAGIAQNEISLSLKEEVEYIHSLGGYICAYICSSALECEDEYLRAIYKAYEIALINEAAECGVDDILIVGLEINETNIAEIEKFVSDAAMAAGKAPLGVLVSRELLLATADGSYVASRVGAVCDYLALDLRALDKSADEAPEGEETSPLDALIGELEYYIEAYRLRAILSRENSSLYSALKELGFTNIQIIAE